MLPFIGVQWKEGSMMTVKLHRSLTLLTTLAPAALGPAAEERNHPLL